MNVVGRVGSFITQGMYSVATPFHPFGGAVDIIVVKQHDGTYRSTPWYVRFGKFQGVLKGAEKLVRIEVNGIEADFFMHLNNSGEACFVREVDPDKDDTENSDNMDIGMARLERTESDNIFYEFQDDQEDFSKYGSSAYDNVDETGNVLESQDSNSEVVLVSVDGLMLKARLSSSEGCAEDLQLNTPQFHLGPVKGTEEFNSDVATLGDTDDYISDLYVLEQNKCTTEEGKHVNHAQETEADNENSSPGSISNSSRKTDVFKSCVELSELTMQSNERELGAVKKVEINEKSPASEEECRDAIQAERQTGASIENTRSDAIPGLAISLCGNLLYPGMSSSAAEEAFNTNIISTEEYRLSAPYIIQNENLIVRVQGKYLPWDKAAHIVLGKAAFGLDLTIDSHDTIPLKQDAPDAKEDGSGMVSTPSRRWRLWPIPFRRAKSLEHSHSTLSNDEFFVDSESLLDSVVSTPSPRFSTQSLGKKILRTNLPTTDQIASLNLKDGQNVVKFVFSTRVLGVQKVEAHIYLWKWNTRIVISDVDGTITKSDVLGQFMPLVGRDWSHSGIARLFSAIKENGYQLMFLSARAIVQSYLTKNFLINLKQDGNTLPNGPVVISPDGLFPSLYREVIRRAPHEFKIACLEDIKALFPPDYNPFYAGFGNRDTDELSYRKMGIPKGKIFIINPKGEVAINRRNDVKSYTSLHTLVHDMFPPTSLANEMLSPTSLVEQEDYNSWNFWKTPLPDIDMF